MRFLRSTNSNLRQPLLTSQDERLTQSLCGGSIDHPLPSDLQTLALGYISDDMENPSDPSGMEDYKCVYACKEIPEKPFSEKTCMCQCGTDVHSCDTDECNREIDEKHPHEKNFTCTKWAAYKCMYDSETIPRVIDKEKNIYNLCFESNNVDTICCYAVCCFPCCVTTSLIDSFYFLLSAHSAIGTCSRNRSRKRDSQLASMFFDMDPSSLKDKIEQSQKPNSGSPVHQQMS